jgi:conjugative relaxase-like TrwC/TraI family protein
LVSVTPLGARPGRDVGAAVAATVEYLDSRKRQIERDLGLERAGSPSPSHDGGAVGYYADSSDQPGRWAGRGVAGIQLRGAVGREQLARMLLAQDPRTGAQLVTRSSAAKVQPTDLEEVADTVSLGEAARRGHIGVGYLRRVARASEAAMVRRAVELVAGAPLTRPPRRWLAAERSGPKGGWRVDAAELARFCGTRATRTTVIAYDVTFSAPKSVSILWACSPPRVRAEIMRAIDGAVAAGVAYLENNAAFVRQRGQRQAADGLLAASYLHTTSRALDPQLHRHVVVASFAASADGSVRTLYSTALFAHAKSAGCVAAAELRHRLTASLGVGWGSVVRGVADIEGIPRAAIRALSTRAAEIKEAIDEQGGSDRRSRQVAAYATRSDKQGDDPATAQRRWASKLADVGFDPADASACLQRTTTRPITQRELDTLFEQLGSPVGVTEQTATFDRRDVVQHIASWAVDRLDAQQVLDFADEWLASGVALRLAPSPRPEVPADRRMADRWLAGGVRYTTREMLDLEGWIIDTFRSGRRRGIGVAPPECVEAMIAAKPTIGADQVEAVRAMTMSGDLVQCLVGPAGTGKTYALEAAAQAWQQAGFDVIGAAVGGTAAEVLGRAAGIRATTLASLLTRIETSPTPVLTDCTVVIVDEASTIGNRDLARLLRHAQAAGCAVRLVGDPAQHTAVSAGGIWRYLAEQFPEATARLHDNRRQAAPELAEVRLAFEDYRQGRVLEAVARLERNDRVVEAASPEQLLDALVTDWYLDRQLARTDGAVPSSMVAEHHSERRELNRRARALLAADGTLTGSALVVDETEFRAGDEVIARTQDRSLRPTDGNRASFVRNGTRGIVLAASDGGLSVDFAGRGPIEIPLSFLDREIRPGVRGGLVHSYCLTSHAAQGETYEAARHLGTDRSTRPGVYVGLTRGRSDVRLYVLRHAAIEPPAIDDNLPRLATATTPLDALTDQLAVHGPEQLARELDPSAPAVTHLRANTTLTDLEASADHTDHAARALVAQHLQIAARATVAPPPDLSDRLGPRPTGGPERRAWDRAVAATAIYRAHWGIGAPQTTASDRQRATWARAQTACHDAAVAVRSARPAATLLTERTCTSDPARLSLIGDALAIQVGRAMRHPAPYLVDLLGAQPPDESPARQRWNDLARAIERYRHNTLGLNPVDGPVSGHRGAMEAAIGPGPTDADQARPWRRLRAELGRHAAIGRRLDR